MEYVPKISIKWLNSSAFHKDKKRQNMRFRIISLSSNTDQKDVRVGFNLIRVFIFKYVLNQ